MYMHAMQRTVKNMTDYLYTRKCDYCGAVIKANREDQRFCSPPKKCHDLWWAKERREKNQIPKLVYQHDKDIQEIKKHLGIQ